MIGLKKNITILCLILLWISCGSERNIELQNNPPSSNLKLKSSFRKLEVLSKEKDNIAVGFLDKLRIKYTVYKIGHPSQEIVVVRIQKRSSKKCYILHLGKLF